MKRKRLFPNLKKTLLAVPAAALMLGASHGAQIGINFQDNYAGNAYAPLTDAAGAFGIPLANWFNAPMVFNSSGVPALEPTESLPCPAGEISVFPGRAKILGASMPRSRAQVITR